MMLSVRPYWCFFLGLVLLGSVVRGVTTPADAPGDQSDTAFWVEKEVFQAFSKMADEVRGGDSSLICNGRLTLTSGTAVTTSNVTAATTIYFTPFNGTTISLYASSKWNLITFAETSVAVPATTTTPFDIFAYSNSGTLALETLNWTNDTTRATALTTQDGVQVKNADATRRYLGTGRTTGSSGQIEDSASKRFLWNMCNREPRKLLAQSTTDSWNYTLTTVRAANNSTTTGTTRVEYLMGMVAEPVSLRVYVPSVYNALNAYAAAGVGVNSTSVNSADWWGGYVYLAYNNITGGYRYFPSLGYSYGQWVEWASASGSHTWYTYDTSNYRIGGMSGEIWQ